MKSLINISNKDGKLVVSSRAVAEHFEKRHNDVVDAIENKIKNLTTENIVVENYFTKSIFIHRGNTYDQYLLTRDGFSFIVMGFTGAKADIWKLKYIEAFNKMEQQLQNNQLPLSFEDMMIKQLEEQKKLKNRVGNIEEKLDSLEISPFQRKQLMNLRSKKIIELLGGKKSQAYKNNSFRGMVYADLTRQYNNYFDIPSYELTPKNRFNEATKLINAYSLSMELALQLEKINSQISISI